MMIELILKSTHPLILNGRGVAQSGSAFGLGPKGQRFESSRPDQ